MARILVTGDEPDLRELFAGWLTLQGHTTEDVPIQSQEVSTGALGTFDLILLDYTELNDQALLAAQAIHESPMHHDAPILLITARPVTPQAANMRAAGVKAQLDKPCSLRHLSKVINDILE